jgi:hypothetical protein
MLALAGCSELEPDRKGGAPPRQPQQTSAAPPVATPAPPAPTDPNTMPPVEVELGCARAFAAGRTALTVPAAVSECVEQPRSAVRQMLDHCEDEAWTLTDCDVPFGSQFCRNSVWTVVCDSDDDCPGGTRCAFDEGVGTVDTRAWGYGWCAKQCQRDLDCVRCDMYCSADDAVCRQRVPDEQEGEYKEADGEQLP